MAALGLCFPDKLHVTGLRRRFMQAAFFSTGLLTLATAVIMFLHFAGKLYSVPLAERTLPLFTRLVPTEQIVGMILIGSFFAMLGLRFGLVRSPEDRRRLVLLNVGSHIAFSPMFILIVRAMVRQRSTFDGVSMWVGVPVILLMLVFPLTLAYLVVVHR